MFKKVFWVVAMTALLFVMPAHAAIVNFDNLSTTLSYPAGGNVGTVYYGIVPNNYAGFVWGNDGWEVMDNANVNKYGNNLSFPSAPNAIYPGNGTISVVSATTFSFQGAYLASWGGANGAGSSLNVEGFLNNVSKGIVTVGLGSSMTWTPIAFAKVDKLTFTSNGYYLLDNFTAVPIPAAGWLLGSGLIGLVGVRRRMKK